MDPRTSTGDADGWFQRARMVWMAMLTAIGLYGVVLMLVTGDGGTGEALPQLRVALRTLATGSCIVAWFVYYRNVARAGIAVAPAPADEAELQRRFATVVMSWGFAETVALCGFVLAMLERSPTDAVTFFALAVVVLVTTRPRPEHFR